MVDAQNHANWFSPLINGFVICHQHVDALVLLNRERTIMFLVPILVRTI